MKTGIFISCFKSNFLAETKSIFYLSANKNRLFVKKLEESKKAAKKIIKKYRFLSKFRVDYCVDNQYIVVCLEKERVQGKTAVSDQSNASNK